MSSLSLDVKPWSSTWFNLPREIRLLLLDTMIKSGCVLAPLAAVCREWQTEIERYNFARITVTPARLEHFDQMTRRSRPLVHYIWFCLELERYDCAECAFDEDGLELDNVDWFLSLKATKAYPNHIATSFHILFSILGKWDPMGDLMLDVSIYSPSDSQHWFKYLTFAPDIPSESLYGASNEQIVPKGGYHDLVCHDPDHDWEAGHRTHAPPQGAFDKVFRPFLTEWDHDEEISAYWCSQLPTVSVVTGLLLRQQNRRKFHRSALSDMLNCFPRLQSFHYEPWRELDFVDNNWDDEGFDYLFDMISWRAFTKKNHLKRLVVFENFNQQYPTTPRRRDGAANLSSSSIRESHPIVARAVVEASLKLEHVAVSFVVDAENFFSTDFFVGLQPPWEWPNLISLTLTSNLLMPDQNQDKVGVMLQAAARAALKMPRLETMEIWNGRKGVAALFKYEQSYETRRATITWKGTWPLTCALEVIEVWEAVALQHEDWTLDLAEEELDEADIESHADAIHLLGLSGKVIRPVSLQQIWIEQSALKGTPTV